LDVSFGKEETAVLVKVVTGIDDAPDACVDKHFGTGKTRLVRNIRRCAFAADAVERGLDDGVLFSVKRSHTVSVHHEMPNFIAMRKPCRRTIVTGGEDAPVTDKDSADMGTVTGAAFGNTEGDVQEIFVPGGALAARASMFWHGEVPCVVVLVDGQLTCDSQ
jgi:hypothetical protein